MAKKKAASAKAATKTKVKPTSAVKRPAAKAASKKATAEVDHVHHEHDHDGECAVCELDASETKAVNMTQKSKAFCVDLENAVNKSLYQTLRKFYRERGVALTEVQAKNVAYTLFYE